MQEHSNRGGGYAFQGHQVWYRREGTGPPLVLFPNAVASDRLWDYQVEHFHARYDVLALNPLGLGLSDRPPAAYPLELYVRLPPLRNQAPDQGVGAGSAQHPDPGGGRC
jgi:pimeloyl-ACP methyl ester carboxylesterase